MRNATRTWLVAVALSGAALGRAAGTYAADGAAAARIPLPSAAAQKAAAKVVDDVYRDDAAGARSAEQKRGLARKWLRAGAETANDPAGRYVLLTRARDLAADAGDMEAALAAAAEVARAYDVDAAAADADVVGRLGRSVKSPDDSRALAKYANAAATEAIAAERYDAARRLVEAASAAAGRANDGALSKLYGGRARDVREAEAAAGPAAKLAAGAARGDDATACTVVGRFRCLTKGDWAGGLPLLARGDDAALKALAEQDLANPATPDAQAALADGWWDLADKAQGPARAQFQIRAYKWYQASLGQLAGLSRAKAERRVKEAEGLVALYGPKVQPANAAVAAAGAPAATAGGAAPSGATELPQGQFTRVWKSPDVWAKHGPENVIVRGNKISVTTEGGTRQVYSDANLVREKDGTLSVDWDTGFEVWSGSGEKVQVSRWDLKRDKDQGKPPSRTGVIAGK